jgi:hypothetical protein
VGWRRPRLGLGLLRPDCDQGSGGCATSVVAASWALAGVGCWGGGEVEALQAVPRSSQKLKVVGGGVDRAG